jgi:hypothetical protein
VDPRGLVAFIVTLNEAAAVIGVLAAAIAALVGVLLFRKVPPFRRFLAITALGVGVGAVAFTVTARALHFTPLDVEVVRVST